MPNRKQRRLWAKQSGLLKKKNHSNLQEQMEMTNRSIQYGNRIHMANTEKYLRDEEDKKNEINANIAAQLIKDGFSQEDALEKINEA